MPVKDSAFNVRLAVGFVQWRLIVVNGGEELLAGAERLVEQIVFRGARGGNCPVF